DSLKRSLRATEEMVRHGVVPNAEIGRSTKFNPETGLLYFTDLQPLERPSADSDEYVQVSSAAYHDVVGHITGNEEGDEQMKVANERLREKSLGAQRDVYLKAKDGTPLSTKD